MTNIFGAANELPKAVRAEDLTSTSFKREEYIDYEPVKEDAGSEFQLEDMLSGNIDEQLQRMEDQLEEEPQAASRPAADEVDDPEITFGLDDLDASMLAEIWNDLRVTVHGELYNWAIYREPKKARKVLEELAMKDQKTEADRALLKSLLDYTHKHQDLRSEYMAAVPYSEKHQALFIRFIEYQMQRMRLQGKTFPVWLMWVYLFLVPEIQAGIKFARIRADLPEFNFDYEQYQRQQNGSH